MSFLFGLFIYPLILLVPTVFFLQRIQKVEEREEDRYYIDIVRKEISYQKFVLILLIV